MIIQNIIKMSVSQFWQFQLLTRFASQLLANPAEHLRFVPPAEHLRFAPPAEHLRFAPPAEHLRFAPPAEHLRFALPDEGWRSQVRWGVEG